MGPHVVRYLVEDGHNVAVFHRGKSQCDLPAGTKELLGCRKEIHQHVKAIEDFAPQVVVDMICLCENDAKSLCEVMSPIAKRLVLISSCDVYSSYGKLIGKEEGDVDESPLGEDAPLRQSRYPYRKMLPSGGYVDDYDKIPAEEIIMNSERLQGTVLRLPMVHGPGDGQHRLLPYVKRADDKRPHIIMEEKLAAWKTTRGYVKNVAWAIALAAMHDKAAGQIFNVADELDYTEEQWATLVTKSCGSDVSVLRCASSELPKKLQSDMNFSHHLLTSSERLRRELGFKEPIPFEETLKRTIEWERSAPTEICSNVQSDYELEDKFLEKR